MVLKLRFLEDFRLPKVSPTRSLRGQGVFSSLMRKSQELILILIFNFSIHAHKRINNLRKTDLSPDTSNNRRLFLSKVQSKNYLCKQGIWKEMKK